MNICDLLNPAIFCTLCDLQWCKDCSFEERFVEQCPKGKDIDGRHNLIFYGVWQGRG